MRFYVSLYLLIAAVYLLSASGRLGLSDSFAMFNVAQSIVTEGSLSSEPCEAQLEGRLNHCVAGVDGRHYSGFGLVPSFLAAPAVVAGDVAARFSHASATAVAKVSVSLFTVLIAPLTCVILAMWIVKLGYSRGTAFWGACTLAFASPYWHFAVKGFYSEPYFTLFVVLAAFLLFSADNRYAIALSGLAFGVACACRMNGIIFYPCFLLGLAFCASGRRLRLGPWLRDAVMFSVPFGACLLMMGWANYARFGSPWRTGYQLAFPSASSAFSNPLARGIYDLLFNGEIGLLVFAPWVLISAICFRRFLREHRPEAVLGAGIFLTSVVFFAKFASWHAGNVAGPRFLAPTLPFLVLMMLPVIDGLTQGFGAEGAFRTWRLVQVTAMIALAAATVIQVLGVIYPEERYYVQMGLYVAPEQVGFYGTGEEIMNLYRGSRARPWWAGSIPLASIEFLADASEWSNLQGSPVDLGHHGVAAVAREESLVRAAVSAAKTPDQFLQSFPNSENVMQPNLIEFKLRAMGAPRFAVFVYCLLAILMGLGGMLGLVRNPQREIIGALPG